MKLQVTYKNRGKNETTFSVSDQTRNGYTKAIMAYIDEIEEQEKPCTIGVIFETEEESCVYFEKSKTTKESFTYKDCIVILFSFKSLQPRIPEEIIIKKANGETIFNNIKP